MPHRVYHLIDNFINTDRHHFDNPVYSFGNGGAANGGAVGGLNNASAIRIRNDLGGKCSINNLEKAKLGLASADNDDISEGKRCLHYSPPPQRAPSTSPSTFDLPSLSKQLKETLSYNNSYNKPIGKWWTRIPKNLSTISNFLTILSRSSLESLWTVTLICRCLRRLSIEHSRTLQEQGGRSGKSKSAQLQHLPHHWRGESLQEHGTPLRRNQTQEQRLRLVAHTSSASLAHFDTSSITFQLEPIWNVPNDWNGYHCFNCGANMAPMISNIPNHSSSWRGGSSWIDQSLASGVRWIIHDSSWLIMMTPITK